MGKPPLGQERTCSTVKEAPHSQNMGVCEGGQPYSSACASVKAPLSRQNPNSSIGREVNQLEAPLSLASFKALLLEFANRWAGPRNVVRDLGE